MILLDTSVLVAALTGTRRTATALRGTIASGERILLPTLVLYEWLRGPRQPHEIAIQETLFPSDSAAPFGVAEAELSANLYRALRRPRGREFDIAIASCAITRQALLWTPNPADFGDIPGIRLWTAP